ncbi:MAG: hypothetical protein MR528_06950 [Lachnospiraceae bacterium]|nr:hypothetical protein [Lachnospiraceae bacterium]
MEDMICAKQPKYANRIEKELREFVTSAIIDTVLEGQARWGRECPKDTDKRASPVNGLQ